MAATAAGVAVLVLSSTMPAAADVVDDGQWYIDVYEIERFHDQGIDGSGVTIAVIDDYINPDAPPLEGANVTVHEENFCHGADGESLGSVVTDEWPLADHGTNVTAMIAGTGAGPGGTEGILGIAPGAHVRFYGVGSGIDDPCYASVPAQYRPSQDDDEDLSFADDLGNAVDNALLQAFADGADIVSVSMGYGTGQATEEILALMQRHGVLFANSVRNAGAEDASQGLSKANGVVGVTSVAADGYPQLRNADQYDSREEALDDTWADWMIGFETDIAAPGIDVLNIGGENWDQQGTATGTSLATPILAGNLALAMQANPEATPHQILQLLIHNTGTDAPHEPVFDETGMFGYGYLDTISLLADDATAYDDVNPFVDTSITNDDIGGPSAAEIAAAGNADTTVTASPDPSASASDGATDTPPAPDSEGGVPTIVWVIVAGVVALVVAIAVIVVVATRNRRST
ncbi:S8/S53 family peptidase [Demequina globuliformis]|uniref:S8/S53 family peptidase n=1 Tax=Demequina globuliformis TaxID=676202 RepID=UPI000782A1F2|nr:S8/S53 family peptidase [Demequina globuliformis]